MQTVMAMLSNYMATGPFHLGLGRLFFMIFFWQAVAFWIGGMAVVMANYLAKREKYKLLRMGVGSSAERIYPRYRGHRGSQKEAEIYPFPNSQQEKEDQEAEEERFTG